MPEVTFATSMSKRYVTLHVVRSARTCSDADTLLLSIGCIELSGHKCLDFIKIFSHLWKIIKSDAHKGEG